MAVMLSNNGAMPTYAAMETRPDVVRLHYRLTGNGAGIPVDKDAGQLGCAIYSIARTSAGLYVIVPNRKFVGAIEGVSIAHVGTLANPSMVLAALNLATPTMSLQVRTANSGAAVDIEAADSVYITIDVRTKVNN